MAANSTPASSDVRRAGELLARMGESGFHVGRFSGLRFMQVVAEHGLEELHPDAPLVR